eukprot:gene31449-16685_t
MDRKNGGPRLCLSDLKAWRILCSMMGNNNDSIMCDELCWRMKGWALTAQPQPQGTDGSGAAPVREEILARKRLKGLQPPPPPAAEQGEQDGARSEQEGQRGASVFNEFTAALELFRLEAK